MVILGKHTELSVRYDIMKKIGCVPATYLSEIIAVCDTNNSFNPNSIANTLNLSYYLNNKTIAFLSKLNLITVSDNIYYFNEREFINFIFDNEDIDANTQYDCDSEQPKKHSYIDDKYDDIKSAYDKESLKQLIESCNYLKDLYSKLYLAYPSSSSNKIIERVCVEYELEVPTTEYFTKLRQSRKSTKETKIDIAYSSLCSLVTSKEQLLLIISKCSYMKDLYSKLGIDSVYPPSLKEQLLYMICNKYDVEVPTTEFLQNKEKRKLEVRMTLLRITY